MTNGAWSAVRTALAGAVVLGACGTWLALSASPAAATINKNTIGCSGHAVITKTNGSVEIINANQSEVHVPRTAKGKVTYVGSVTTITHNHHGFVAVAVGPFKFHFYSWDGKNRSNKNTDTGTRAYPSELKDIPPGKYRVTGGHFAPEGSCTGSMTIVIDGSPFSNPLGIAVLAGTVLFALVAAIGLFGHPIVGAIGGVLLGLFLAPLLMVLKVSYLSSPLLFGLPAAGLVVGVLIGLWGPLGGSSTT